MANTQKRRQAALEHKAAKRKQKQQAKRQAVPASERAVLRSASQWPLDECLVSRNWDTEGELVQMLVARRSPSNRIAAGVFLVDLGCLGVKDAFARLFDSSTEYRKLQQVMSARMPMKKADPNLAARIIRAGIEYARGLGFSPHADYYEASPLLEGTDPDAVSTPVPLGRDGKPFFIAGPFDNVPRIIAKLDKAVGPGNYDLLAPIEPPIDFLEEDNAA